MNKKNSFIAIMLAIPSVCSMEPSAMYGYYGNDYTNNSSPRHSGGGKEHSGTQRVVPYSKSVINSHSRARENHYSQAVRASSHSRDKENHYSQAVGASSHSHRGLTVTFSESFLGEKISGSESLANQFLGRLLYRNSDSMDNIKKAIFAESETYRECHAQRLFLLDCAKALRHITKIEGGDEFKRAYSTGADSLVYDKSMLNLSRDILVYLDQIRRDDRQDYQYGQTQLHLSDLERAISLGQSIGAKKKAKEDEENLIPNALSLGTEVSELDIIHLKRLIKFEMDETNKQKLQEKLNEIQKKLPKLN